MGNISTNTSTAVIKLNIYRTLTITLEEYDRAAHEMTTRILLDAATPLEKIMGHINPND